MLIAMHVQSTAQNQPKHNIVETTIEYWPCCNLSLLVFHKKIEQLFVFFNKMKGKLRGLKVKVRDTSSVVRPRYSTWSNIATEDEEGLECERDDADWMFFQLLLLVLWSNFIISISPMDRKETISS